MSISELAQQRLAERAGRHPGRGFPGAGPLQHVAGLGKPYFCMPARSAWPGRGWVSGLAVAPGRRRHLLGPLGPLGVADHDGHRRAERAAVADAAQEGQLVGLEAHPRAAAVTQAPAGQLAGNILSPNGQPGGQAFDDDDEALAVGLAGGEEAKHDRSSDGPVSAAPFSSAGHRPLLAWATVMDAHEIIAQMTADPALLVEIRGRRALRRAPLGT